MVRGTRRSLALALILLTVAGCQAPGFMGLSGSETGEAGTSETRVARARFRVLVPASLGTGLPLVSQTMEATGSRGYGGDRAVTGALVFLEAQPAVRDTTDADGYASLAVPVGALTPVRAEFQTPDGLVSMTGLAYLDPQATEVPTLALTVASTLVTSRLAQRFRFAELAYLDALEVARATEVVDRALRTPQGDVDPRYMPRLVRQWSVLELAESMARLDPVLNGALARVLVRRSPTPGPASGSLAPLASASAGVPRATPDATLSVPASSSLRVGDARLFPLSVGRSWVYDLLDESGEVVGTHARVIERLAPRPGALLATSRETGDWAGEEEGLRFLVRRSAQGIRVAGAFRPSVVYPLPLSNGRKWAAAPEIEAIAHAPAASPSLDEAWPGAWRVDFKRQRPQGPVRWSEWLVPDVGFVRMQWVDLRDDSRHEAVLQLPPEPTPSP